MSYGLPDSRLGRIEDATEIQAAQLSQLRGFSGPAALTPAFQSPLNRWAPVNDRRDSLECSIGGGVCRVWLEVRNLDPAYEYALELRAVVRDLAGGALAARAYRLPRGDQVNLPVEVLLEQATTLGTGAVQGLTIAAQLLGDDTPCRVLFELAAGAPNANATPYRLYQLEPVVSEVGPIS